MRFHRIKQRRGLERTAMQGRVAVERHGREMLRGGVALVAVVAVARIGLVMPLHLAIAGHLGDDRRRGHRAHLAVALGHAHLRHHQIGNLEGVHHHHVGQRHEHADGLAHGVERGAVDVDAIDFAGGRRGDGPGQGLAGDDVVEPLALEQRSSSWSRTGPGCAGPGSRMTAPATTGPARQPRPTSSQPATRWKPHRRRAFSRLLVARTLTIGAWRRDRGRAARCAWFPSCAPPCPSGRAGSTAWRAARGPTAPLRPWRSSASAAGRCARRPGRTTPCAP